MAQEDHYSFNRTAVDDVVAAEVKAVREAVGIMDVTAFTKVVVEGPDAYALLDRLTANRMPQKVGSITLTHMLNRAGRIELETTIVRMAEDRVLPRLRRVLRATICWITLNQNRAG